MTYTTLRLNYRLAGYWIQSNSAHFSDYKLETADQGGAVVYAHFQQQRIEFFALRLHILRIGIIHLAAVGSIQFLKTQEQVVFFLIQPLKQRFQLENIPPPSLEKVLVAPPVRNFPSYYLILIHL